MRLKERSSQWEAGMVHSSGSEGSLMHQLACPQQSLPLEMQTDHHSVCWLGYPEGAGAWYLCQYLGRHWLDAGGT